ncbi:MAG: RidA family protein [Acidobacteriota bacterium]
MSDRSLSTPLTSALLLSLLLFAGCAPPVEEPAGAQEAAEPDVAAGTVIADRLAELGVELPEPSPPVANYVRATTSGNLVFLAGHIPVRPDGTRITGKLGGDLTVEQGYEAARFSAIGLLASLRQEIGSLDRVTRILKVTGMVNSAPDFTEQSAVINGCSDFLVEVFGEKGKHARAAVGMASLPVGAAVEVEMIVEIQ